MNFRWTMKELEAINDKNKEGEKEMIKFIGSILTERQSSLSNVYSPLYRKIGEAKSYLEKIKPLNKK